jgi:hypothetical protein
MMQKERSKKDWERRLRVLIPSLATMGPSSALAFPSEGALSFSD